MMKTSNGFCNNNIKKALIVGGSNGIGLAIALKLAHNNGVTVTIVDIVKPNIALPNNIKYLAANLRTSDYSLFDEFQDIDCLVCTVGIGRVASFADLTDLEVTKILEINTVATIKLIKHFYKKINHNTPFYCAMMVSIAGKLSSPLFSVYGASKAALSKFIESINIELEMNSISNRILDVSPGSIKGTNFNGGETDLTKLNELANAIINKMKKRENLYIPDFDKIFKNVLNEYTTDSHTFGINSYKYKLDRADLTRKPQIRIGYLSGTFDLFHIGHLNLLRTAKQHCDYLVVGVHKSGAWKKKETFIPFLERLEIVKSIKYVDRAIESFPEDCDAWELLKYNFLFVGSDYEGSVRFKRYEEIFKNKDVKILYFPYTTGTSSTKLRAALDILSK